MDADRLYVVRSAHFMDTSLTLMKQGSMDMYKYQLVSASQSQLLCKTTFLQAVIGPYIVPLSAATACRTPLCDWTCHRQRP